MIPEEAIADIKARADLAAIIGRTVKLKKVGRNYVGLCPFHTEKSPSFNVRPDEGFFYCFGCKAAGDVVEFLVRTTGRGFLDIVTDLAHETGVELPREKLDPAEEQRQKDKKRLLRVLELAQVFFRTRLQSDQGTAARAYLADKRKMDEAAIDRFGIGFGGVVDDGLLTFLKEQGIASDDAVLAGVCARGERGAYDFFRHRITFPIRGVRGEVLSFSGRIFGEREVAPDGTKRPKYVNGPQSPVYDKSQVLYGLSESLPSLKKGQPAILVEGAVDAIAVHRAGVLSAVAPCGTSLTPRHVEELKRRAQKVVVCLDADAAGREATTKAILMLLQADLEVAVVALPDKDPDQMVAAGRSDELKAMILAAPSALDARLTEAQKRSAGNVQARVTAIDELLPFLAAPARELIRTNAIRAVARAFSEDEGVIAREVEKRGRQMLAEKLRGTQQRGPQARGPQPRGAPAGPMAALAARSSAGGPGPQVPVDPRGQGGDEGVPADPREVHAPRPAARAAVARQKSPPFTEAEGALAESLLMHPQLAARCGVLVDSLKNKELAAFIASLIDLLVRYHDAPPRSLLARVPLRPSGYLPHVLEKLAHAQAFSHPDSYLSEAAAGRVVEDTLLRLERRVLERRLGEIQPLLQAADERQDHGERKRLLVEQQSLLTTIRELTGEPAAAAPERPALAAPTPGPLRLVPPASVGVEAGEPAGPTQAAPTSPVDPRPASDDDDVPEPRRPGADPAWDPPWAGDPEDDPWAT